MSGFLWDVFSERDLSSVRPDAEEAATQSVSPGYSPDSPVRPAVSGTPVRVPSDRPRVSAPSRPAVSAAPTEVPCDPPRTSVPPCSAVSQDTSAEGSESAPAVPTAGVEGGADSLTPREIRSSLDAEGVAKVCRALRIGPEFRPRPARSDERVCTYREGEVAIFVHNIRMGLRPPFNRFFRLLFSVYGLMPCQLVPNSYRCVIGFLEVCRRQNIAPTIDLFHLIFLCSASPDYTGWYYFRLRMKAHGKFLKGRSSSVHNWKDKFFFISIPTDWDFNREWGEPSKRAMAKPDPTLTDELQIARLKFGQFDGLVDVTRPSAEMLDEIDRYLESLEG
jgi:hypothetical protein